MSAVQLALGTGKAPYFSFTGSGTEADPYVIAVGAAGLETLLTAIAGYVDGLEGYTDGLETLLTTLGSKLDTIDGHVDGLEALITTLNGYCDGLETLLASSGYTSQPTVTRPANTTAYADGDVVGGVITFTSAGPSGGHLLITDADLRIDVSAVPSGMSSFRLHLYDASPASAYADNAAWDLPAGDRANYLGFVDIGTPADLGSTLFCQAPSANKKVKLAAASTSLYGYLQAITGFTPAGNSEVYTPRLGGTGL